MSFFMIFDNFGTRNPMLESFALSGNYKIFKMADTKWGKWPICLPNTVIFRCDHLCEVELSYQPELSWDNVNMQAIHTLEHTR